MALQIWLISEDRKHMIENQRAVNRSGSMRAVCILSVEALDKAISSIEPDTTEPPVVIILDDCLAIKREEETLRRISRDDVLAGVPLFLAVAERDEDTDSSCYARGAMVIVHETFTPQEITRIEHTAWQYANTKRYEQKLQMQAAKLKSAKEILMLNKQLETRNQLLYKIFRRYFSDEVVDLIIEQGEEVSLGGEKRNVTVMMSDLRSFTALSENMDSERVTILLNHYFSRMVEIISAHHGTVIEFLGDGLLAVFGAPLYSELSTDDAVAAAIEMQNAMADVNLFCAENDFPHLEMGIGLHEGEVFIGNIGSEQVMRYNVIGSAVNECSRIESCSIGGQVLASGTVIDSAVSPIEIANKALVSAKGFAQPIMIYELAGIGGDFDCRLTKTEEELTRIPAIPLSLCPILGKVVGDTEIPVQLFEYSEKSAVIELCGDDPAALHIYDNVKIVTGSADYSPDQLYAKVIGQRDAYWILHFTAAGPVTAQFIDWIKKREV